MIVLNQGLTKEERLFQLVNSHPNYSAVWAERHPEEAEQLIERIRKENGLEWVSYSLLVSKDHLQNHAFARNAMNIIDIYPRHESSRTPYCPTKQYAKMHANVMERERLFVERVARLLGRQVTVDELIFSKEIQDEFHIAAQREFEKLSEEARMDLEWRWITPDSIRKLIAELYN